MTGDRLRLFLRDCRVELRIGINANEQTRTQPVTISVECEMAAHRRFDDIGENALADTMDYSKIHSFLREELPRMGHICLVESAAEKIAAFCLGDPRVVSVRVRVEKTAVYPDAAGAGVELLRMRDGT